MDATGETGNTKRYRQILSDILNHVHRLQFIFKLNMTLQETSVGESDVQ